MSAVAGYGLERESVALTEQIVTISKECLRWRLGTLAGTEEMRGIELALKRQMDVA